MCHIAGNHSQRVEHKSSIPTRRMRNLQARIVESPIAVKDQIQVESPRSPPWTGARTGAAFKVLQQLEQSQGLKARFDPCGRVQEFASRPLSDRLGAEDGTERNRVDPRCGRQAGQGRAEILLDVADVAAQGNVTANSHRPLRSRLRRSRVATPGAENVNERTR